MSLLWLALALQAERPYSLKAAIESGVEEGRPVFRLGGETDLPDGAMLYLDLFRSGAHVGAQLFTCATRVEAGRWREVAKVFPDRALPGRYYLRARFSVDFQDRKEVAEAMLKSNRPREGAVEAWLQIGEREDFERALRESRRHLAGELDALGSIAEEAVGQGEIEELRRRVLQIERRNSDRVDYRYFELTGVSQAGIERIRGAIWGMTDARVRQGDPSELQRRLEMVRQLVKRYKAELGDVNDVGSLRSERVESIRRILGRGAGNREAQSTFDLLVLELAHFAPADRYSDVQELAELGRAWLEQPKGSDEADLRPGAIEAILRRLDR
jgi:hypothetical protein